jgi:hypothetical protein
MATVWDGCGEQQDSPHVPNQTSASATTSTLGQYLASTAMHNRTFKFCVA